LDNFQSFKVKAKTAEYYQSFFMTEEKQFPVKLLNQFCQRCKSDRQLQQQHFFALHYNFSSVSNLSPKITKKDKLLGCPDGENTVRRNLYTSHHAGRVSMAKVCK